MVLGRGEVWAETVTETVTITGSALSQCAVSGEGGSKEFSSGIITFRFTSTKDRAVQYTTDLKLQSGGTTMTVSCPSYATIKSIELTISSGSKFNSMTASDGSFTSDNVWEGSTQSVTFTTGSSNNVDNVTSIIVTYTDSRASLSPAFDWNNMEIHNAGGDQHTYVCSSTFVYDSSKDRMKVRLTVTPRYEGIYGTISSTDETVLKTTTYTLSGPTATTVGEQDAWEIYIDNIQVLKTGSATLRFWFNGNESYKPATLEIPITVIDHSVTPFNNSYRYTWDFAGGNWESTIAQLGYGNGSGGYNWTKTIASDKAEARPTYKEHSTIPAQNGLDIIEGLKFELPIDEGTGDADPNDLCLDWYAGRKAVWLNTDVKVTISNLVKDQTITITADNDNYTMDAGSATKSGNVITVTGAGNVTLKMAQATRISSIAVSNSSYRWSYTTETASLENKERPIKGTFTFTEAGPIEAGTEINEVPGIIMKVGADEDSWDVIPATSLDGNNLGAAAAYCSTKINNQSNPTRGCFYSFMPIVNGELKIHYYTTATAFIYENGTQVGSNSGQRIQDITIFVEAGKTYKLVSSISVDWGGCLHLNSFTFRPVFYNPGTTTDQLSIEDPTYGNRFVATIGNPAKDGFPKLIDPSSETQQNKVKFAGDKAKVYLYKNNDVELLAAADDILIRGTVLDKNNEDGLVAYYYLNSQIITLKSAELEDQAYISSGGLTDDKYTFTYNGNIVANGGTLTVKVKKDAGEEYDVTATVNSYDSSNDQTTIDIPFASLEEGATYRVRIPTNTLQLSVSPTVKNSEVVRTFSVNKNGEAQVKIIYPTGIATVGTAIILETYINGEAKNVNDGHKVKGILSDGSSNLNLDATFSSSQIVFKPETTLKPNTTYTLTIPTGFGTEPNIVDNKIYLSTKYTTSPEDVYYQVTHNKVFTFTTGSSSGTEPQVIPNGTYPAEGAVVSSGEYSGGTISFTFNQSVDLEPYSTVTATPVNGSESTATGKTGAPNTVGTLTVGEDGKTVSFNYSEDELKYDLYYQVVIPANTVIGAGGLPNSTPITLKFKMGKKSSSISKIGSSSFLGYPFTWDFTKIGIITDTKTKLTEKATSGLESTTRWLYDSSNHYYGNFSDGVDFPQGEVLSYNNGTEDVEIAETQGLRWSLTKRNASSVNHRLRIMTNPASLYVLGNTHYLTIPNVPVGKLYIKAKHSDILNVNSPNAVFVEGGMQGDNTKGATTTSSRVYILNVMEAGDVTFCLDDVYLEMIAVATDEKTFKSGFAKSGKTYATDRLTYDVRYDLLNTLTNHKVKPYYVTGITDNAEDNTATINAREVTDDVAGADEGVILLYEGEVLSDTNVPIFKADVNTEDQSGQTNTLKVVPSGTTTVPTPAGDYYMYVLSNRGSKSEGVAFYRYTGSSFSDRAAYLEVPKYMVNPSISGGSARAFRMVFFDEDGSETTVVRAIEKDGITETVEQSGGYYDLRGLRLAKPDKRGLYIKDGKKIYVK